MVQRSKPRAHFAPSIASDDPPPPGFHVLGFGSNAEIDAQKWTNPCTAQQWQTAFQLFDRMGPFTPEQIELVNARLPTVLQAAFVGLLRVIEYDKGFWEPQTLPAMPETRGHRYVYIRSCAEG